MKYAQQTGLSVLVVAIGLSDETAAEHKDERWHSTKLRNVVKGLPEDLLNHQISVAFRATGGVASKLIEEDNFRAYISSRASSSFIDRANALKRVRSSP